MTLKIEAAQRLTAGYDVVNFGLQMEKVLPWLKFHPSGAGMPNILMATTDEAGGRKATRALNKIGYGSSSYKGPQGFRTDGKWMTSKSIDGGGDVALWPMVFISKPEANGAVRIALWVSRRKKIM